MNCPECDAPAAGGAKACAQCGAPLVGASRPDGTETSPEEVAGGLAAEGRMEEALSHLTGALELVRGLPEGPERIDQELSLHVALGPVLAAMKGPAHPEVEASYRRARELCLQAGDSPRIVPVLFGLWSFFAVRGELQTARELAEQILRVAAGSGDRGILLEGHLIFGITLYFLAELPMARQQLESALAHYRPESHRAHAEVFGQEPGMASHIYLAKCCWLSGDTEAAEAHCRESARIAAESGHPHSVAYALAYETLVRHLMGDVEGTERLADRTIALSEEHGFLNWLACGEVLKGWARCERGQTEPGIVLMRAGIAQWLSTGTNLYSAYWLGLLGCAESGRGNFEAALRLVRQAVALETRGEERVVLAELHRLHGEILRQTREGDSQLIAEAEETIVSACAIARRQGAIAWERRAALTLAASVQSL